ncbi:cAMP/cGMP-dependent protein kinase [Carpediemonas membranifera]|uniref:cAMP/cGMP-dependent protein kinase n=1 Tax=Carpediemonas membranifera TaxID=201153 RepID=A0A8J6ASR2_9EUKA|nr:cAMP/cGMP-dependent protein kinase [Carpediemonas membranifera]|eukprot:KAG9390555.1 cAMP/cGMP-dependent protein kinase [Carpediemonas membranifera]
MDRRQDLQEYLEQTRVKSLLSNMMKDLVFERPENPVDFCRNYLRGILEAKQAEHEDHLEKAMKEVQIIASLDPSQRENVRQRMVVAEYKKDTTIVAEVAPMHSLYIILSGTVVRINRAETMPLLMRPMHTFGEAAVVHRGPRRINSKFTYKAAEDCVIARISFEDWAATQVQQVVEAKSRVLAFLHGVSLFNGLPESQYQLISEKLEIAAFQQGEVIVREGDVGDRFYIITSGECFVHKMSLAGVDDIGSGIGLPISVLREADIFGEIALVKDVPRQASISAKTPVSLLTLDKETFQQVLSPLCLESLFEHIGQYEGGRPLPAWAQAGSP